MKTAIAQATEDIGRALDVQTAIGGNAVVDEILVGIIGVNTPDRIGHDIERMIAPVGVDRNRGRDARDEIVGLPGLLRIDVAVVSFRKLKLGKHEERAYRHADRIVLRQRALGDIQFLG